MASGAGLDCGDLFVHVAVRSAVRYCASSASVSVSRVSTYCTFLGVVLGLGLELYST